MREYLIRVCEPERNMEAVLAYDATSLGEALSIVERGYAGRADVLIGILPEDYPEAVEEGIEFNEADGVIL